MSRGGQVSTRQCAVPRFPLVHTAAAVAPYVSSHCPPPPFPWPPGKNKKAAGYTVSPLMPKYVAAAAAGGGGGVGGESQESLVTLVLKADLGGLLAGAPRGCWGGGGAGWGWLTARGRWLMQCCEGHACVFVWWFQSCGLQLKLRCDALRCLSPLPSVSPAERSWVGRLMGPLGAAALRAALEPVISSVVVLRETVEQNKFVVRCVRASPPPPPHVHRR